MWGRATEWAACPEAGGQGEFSTRAKRPPAEKALAERQSPQSAPRKESEPPPPPRLSPTARHRHHSIPLLGMPEQPHPHQPGGGRSSQMDDQMRGLAFPAYALHVVIIQSSLLFPLSRSKPVPFSCVGESGRPRTHGCRAMGVYPKPADALWYHRQVLLLDQWCLQALARHHAMVRYGEDPMAETEGYCDAMRRLNRCERCAEAIYTREARCTRGHA